MFWIFASLAGLNWLFERFTGSAGLTLPPSTSSTPSTSAPTTATTRPSSPSSSTTKKPASPSGVPQDGKRLDVAAGWARQVLEQLKARGKQYDREVMKKFQRAAGISVDGAYGPQTAGALDWYTKDPKTGKGQALPPFVGGPAMSPYSPPF